MEIKQCKQFYYRVQENDDFQILTEKFNTNKENIVRNNPNLNLYVGEWILIKENDYISHLVKPTETLTDVSKKHNISEDKIMKDNNLSSTKLYIGQILKIKKD